LRHTLATIGSGDVSISSAGFIRQLFWCANVMKIIKY
jgi:hypothetical protein